MYRVRGIIKFYHARVRLYRLLLKNYTFRTETKNECDFIKYLGYTVGH